MAILSNQRRGSGLSRYNFKDDMMMVMGWIEKLRNPALEAEGQIAVDGFIDAAQVNRIRSVLGMPTLQRRKLEE